MNLTLEEVKLRLKQLPEDVLIDVMGLCAEDIIERFDDVIEANLPFYIEQLSDWDFGSDSDDWYEDE